MQRYFKDVGNDNLAETVDNCAAANDCRKLKNALQADPVATGPADSRFITKAYIGDLDGRIWRFEAAKAFEREIPTIFIEEVDGELAGFAAHDVNNRGLGFFGPTGVKESMGDGDL